MLTKEQIVEILREYKPYLKKELGITSVGLFGSYARGAASSDSDVDIMIEMEEPNWNRMCIAWDLLEKKLNAKIDLVRKGPHLRERFLKTVEQEIVYA